MKIKKILFLLPFLLLAITKCEKPKRRRRDLDRERVKSEKRPPALYKKLSSVLYRIRWIIIFIAIVMFIIKKKKENEAKKDLEFYEEARSKESPFLFACESEESEKKVLRLIDRLLEEKKYKNNDKMKELNASVSMYFGELEREKTLKKERDLSDSNREKLNKIIKLLVDKGALIGNNKENVVSYFHYTCIEGHLGYIKSTFTELKNWDDEAKRKGFYYACEYGHVNVVNYLMKDIMKLDLKEGKTVDFSKVCKGDRVEVVDYLLSKGLKFNVKDTKGKTLADSICCGGHLQLFDYLLKEKIRFDLEKEVQFTKKADKDPPPLHCALELYGEEEKKKKKSEYFLSLQKNRISIIDTLIARLNLKAKCKNKFHVACYYDLFDVAKLFWKEGINLDTEIFDKKRALDCACMKGNLDLVNFLLEKGANYEDKNSWNLTPLHYAALSNKPEVIRALIDKKNKDEKKDKKKNKAEKNKAMVDFINAKNTQGDTPLSIARKYGKINAVDFLENYLKNIM